ncbi:MAG: hypothetical protein IE917_06680 [Betaproteobacteria bacterium]|nr:hypothetical protein [Betaproteobacteria bacterium]
MTIWWRTIKVQSILGWAGRLIQLIVFKQKKYWHGLCSLWSAILRALIQTGEIHEKTRTRFGSDWSGGRARLRHGG